MIESPQRVAFLDKIHLFNGLDQGQLGGIAGKLTEKEVAAGATIFKRGDKPDGFYLIYKGKVKVTMPTPEKGERQIAMLTAGDYFGEEAIFENRNRSATITAVDACVLLFVSRPVFDSLLEQYEKLKPNFKVSIRSRKLARSTNFKWLGKNEVIYFIARRHKIRLYQALVAPGFSLLIPIVLFVMGFISQAVTPWAVGTIALVIILLWGLWNAIDWSNDYYIVTNQRVIWLEKVIFLYDSREEAPLGSILSVGVESDALGRILDYGNVIVRTFVGKLEFDHVDHPVQAADMIREYWERTKAMTTRSQIDVMKDTIKQKLGMPLEKRPQPELSPIVPLDEEKTAKMPLWLLAMQNLFQLRIEDGGKVIYRKHWIVLLQQGWKAFGVFTVGLYLFLWRLVFLAQSPDLSFLRVNSAGTYSPDTLAVTIPLLLMPVTFWVWYEYTDWKNDIFMVTNDEIFDIDRKPFGKEERRSAQIENILSTSYTRSGPIAYMFNYGTVKITVGGTQMGFEDVMDPASVQADINRRRSTRIAKKNEDAGKDDRERFATWLAAYHQNINEFTTQTKPATADPSTNPFTAAGQNLDHIPQDGDIVDDDHDGDGYGGSGDGAGGGE
ncbi:MAG TPA: cyclic nucleotide-binding domain-containing protein [Anaerolineales bacterium]|nr:cyclic nucleotide-binding domain-containing protein [Anaerolineales bacterium]